MIEARAEYIEPNGTWEGFWLEVRTSVKQGENSSNGPIGGARGQGSAAGAADALTRPAIVTI